MNVFILHNFKSILSSISENKKLYFFIMFIISYKFLIFLMKICIFNIQKQNNIIQSISIYKKVVMWVSTSRHCCALGVEWVNRPTRMLNLDSMIYHCIQKRFCTKMACQTKQYVIQHTTKYISCGFFFLYIYSY